MARPMRAASPFRRAALGAGLDRGQVHVVEEHRRLREQVEHEHQDARQQDERLERHLDEGAEQQRTAPLILRLRRQVALNLALVAAKVGEHQEDASDDSRPERVVGRQVEREIDRPQPASRSRDAQRIAERDVVREAEHEQDHRRAHAQHDHTHLLDVGPRDRLHAAEHRVGHRRHANGQHRQGEVPAEHDRQDDRRRREDDTAGQAARHQEERRRQHAGLRIEPLLQVLVGRVDARPVEERDDGDRQDHHGDGQAKVELHEAHAVGVALACGAHQRHRAHLRGHHRQAGRPPREAPIRQQVAVHLVGRAGPLQPVVDDPDEIGADDEPIDEVHDVSASRRVTRRSNDRMSTRR
jgi:hypothetical protein